MPRSKVKTNTVTRVEQREPEPIEEAVTELPQCIIEDQGIKATFDRLPFMPLHVRLGVYDIEGYCGEVEVPLQRLVPQMGQATVACTTQAFWKRQKELDRLATLETAGS